MTVTEGCAEALKAMQEAVGEDVMVTEVDAFVARCGCSGLVFMFRGLETEDVSDELVKTALKAAESVGLKPDVVYVRTVPGTDVVIDVGVRELCERCSEEFSGDRPRPDLRVVWRRG
ncbi:MAG: DUF5402 family protein [Methanopyri archaeon]|nr:DUF5402 family protein [Methanopyri archaeon]